MSERNYYWQDRQKELMRLFRGLPKGRYEPHVKADYIYLEDIDTGETFIFKR